MNIQIKYLVTTIILVTPILLFFMLHFISPNESLPFRNEIKVKQYPVIQIPSSVNASEKNSIVLNGFGKPQQVDYDIKINQDGSKSVVVKPVNQFMPGKYTFVVKDIDGKTYEQDFSWGVLAINTNKSLYHPHEKAILAMAVLDEKGKMVCDAQVKLSIKSPDNSITELTTINNNIRVNPECHLKDFTIKPDYEAEYMVNSIGLYHLTLNAVTSNGSYTIEDTFEARSGLPFEIERSTATRIYPIKNYPVDLTVYADADFNGTIKEHVPKSFTIIKSNGDNDSFTVSSTADSKEIAWDLMLRKGEVKTLHYIYHAPEVSPQFYLLGPISLTTKEGTLMYQETRKWQIASDAITWQESKTGAWSAGTTLSTSANLTAVTNDLYLATVAIRQNTITVSSISGPGTGLTWSLVKYQCSWRGQTHVEVWKAIGTPNANGAVTVTLSGTPNAADVVVSRFTGVDTSSPLGTGVGNNTTDPAVCNGGVSTNDNSSPTVSLTTGQANSFAYGGFSTRGQLMTVGTGYTEGSHLQSSSAGDATTATDEYKSVASASTVAVDGSLGGNIDWAAVAVEIKVAAATPTDTPTPTPTDTPTPTPTPTNTPTPTPTPVPGSASFDFNGVKMEGIKINRAIPSPLWIINRLSYIDSLNITVPVDRNFVHHDS